MGPLEIANLHKLLESENLIPQAVIGTEIGPLLSKLGAGIETGWDDLDGYAGAGFVLGDMPFAVMRYEGHPPATSTIYLPRRFHDVDEISEAVNLITSKLGISEAALVWQRRDNPEL
ncbi:MAG: hypothetical protein HXX10_00575 [Rhodoplanes sp.]|uniref:hypothetical protein n=1 Tax=Rhodoplanes sp. TaxID=1968906 RepID=UPI0017C17653|nr:hypothetical protein [Rhodoplanes sp.]NVO12510.1 hypothetical protein [Rhodoplanes sp.]